MIVKFQGASFFVDASASPPSYVSKPIIYLFCLIKSTTKALNDDLVCRFIPLCTDACLVEFLQVIFATYNNFRNWEKRPDR